MRSSSPMGHFGPGESACRGVALPGRSELLAIGFLFHLLLQPPSPPSARSSTLTVTTSTASTPRSRRSRCRSTRRTSTGCSRRLSDSSRRAQSSKARLPRRNSASTRSRASARASYRARRSGSRHLASLGRIEGGPAQRCVPLASGRDEMKQMARPRLHALGQRGA